MHVQRLCVQQKTVEAADNIMHRDGKHHRKPSRYKGGFSPPTQLSACSCTFYGRAGSHFAMALHTGRAESSWGKISSTVFNTLSLPWRTYMMLVKKPRRSCPLCV